MAYKFSQKEEALLKLIKIPKTVDKDDGEDERLIALGTVKTLVRQINEERELQRKKTQIERVMKQRSRHLAL